MAKKKVALAEALLRRKELMLKVQQLHVIKEKNCFENRVKRVKVSDGIDEVTVDIALVSMASMTKEYDFYAQALRQIDSRIQRANWETEIEVETETLKNFEA